MKRMDHIGVDLGLVSQAVERATAAAEIGARVARLRFGLGGATEMGPSFLATAREAVAGLADKGLKVLAVVDSDLTVAPDGMGAFSDRPQGPLARAWVEEMLANTGDLARALAGSVEAWELLPLPNAGPTPRIHPVRWAALLEALGAAIRVADPQARIVTGALLSDDRDDGAAYLEAALAAAGNRVPGDILGLRLAIMAGGSPSEAILAAGLRDRVERLTDVLSQQLGGEAAAAVDLWVTSVGWDAQAVGEVNQATNAWTALNALSGHPRVSGVIWCGLTDDNPNAGGMASGLFQGGTALSNLRRPAGNAFRDFSTYARQISMPAAAAAVLLEDDQAAPSATASDMPALDIGDSAGAATGSLELAPQRPERVEDSGGWTTAGVAGAAALAALAPLSEQDRPQAAEAPALPTPGAAAPPVTTEITLEPPATVIAAEPSDSDGQEAPIAEAPEAPGTAATGDAPQDSVEAPAEETPPATLEAPVSEAPPAIVQAPAEEAEPAALHFHIPNAREVLEALGHSGEELDRILEAVRRRYGSYQWLPAGDYHVDVPAAADAPAIVEPPAVDEPPAVVVPPAVDEPPAIVEPPAVDEPPAVVVPPAVDEPPAIVEPPAVDEPPAIVVPPAVDEPPAVVVPPAVDEPPAVVVPPAVVPSPAFPPLVPQRPAITNQMMISALYRAGGGAWGLFDRAGLSLRDLAARRTQPYSGPALAAMAGLSAEEQEAVQRELDSVGG